MWVVELIMDIFSFVDDIRFASHYGWGSFLWGLATVVCGIVTYLFFYYDFVVLGVIGIIGTVTCLVLGCRQTWRDIRKKREAEARFREKQNAK